MENMVPRTAVKTYLLQEVTRAAFWQARYRSLGKPVLADQEEGGRLANERHAAAFGASEAEIRAAREQGELQARLAALEQPALAPDPVAELALARALVALAEIDAGLVERSAVLQSRDVVMIAACLCRVFGIFDVPAPRLLERLRELPPQRRGPVTTKLLAHDDGLSPAEQARLAAFRQRLGERS